jgi:hypothetical protein
MTVYKKHTRPNGESGVCSADVKCRYGKEARHFFYDSSIKQEVLDPSHPIQRRLDNVSSDELLEKAPDLYAEGKEPSPEYQEAYTAFTRRVEEYYAQREQIIKSYPVKHQSAVRQLTGMHEGAGMIASFDIFDPDEEDFTVKSEATDDEKMKFAKTYLEKFKAEAKVRAYISASHA